MAKNEKTSKRVASIAGKLLRAAKKYAEYHAGEPIYIGGFCFYSSDFAALAASCLTQTADKPKKKARGKKNAKSG